MPTIEDVKDLVQKTTKGKQRDDEKDACVSLSSGSILTMMKLFEDSSAEFDSNPDLEEKLKKYGLKEDPVKLSEEEHGGDFSTDSINDSLASSDEIHNHDDGNNEGEDNDTNIDDKDDGEDKDKQDDGTISPESKLDVNGDPTIKENGDSKTVSIGKKSKQNFIPSNKLESSVLKYYEKLEDATCMVIGNKTRSLCEKLKKHFEIDPQEEFVAEYSSWLLRDVLIQGHLYLTTTHLCFFASLPRSRGSIIFSSKIEKKDSIGSTRYWGVLSDTTLSLYTSPRDLYFPASRIDLRTIISVEPLKSNSRKSSSAKQILENPLSSSPGTPKTRTRTPTGSDSFSEDEEDNHGVENSNSFKITTTDQKSIIFQCDSTHSSKVWINSLQKEIFQSKNVGNYVLIKLPIRLIIEISDTPAFDIGKIAILKVENEEEKKSTDEYHFMFFQKGEEAIETIQNLFDLIPESEPPIFKGDILDTTRRSIDHLDTDAKKKEETELHTSYSLPKPLERLRSVNRKRRSETCNTESNVKSEVGAERFPTQGRLSNPDSFDSDSQDLLVTNHEQESHSKRNRSVSGLLKNHLFHRSRPSSIIQSPSEEKDIPIEYKTADSSPKPSSRTSTTNNESNSRSSPTNNSRFVNIDSVISKLSHILDKDGHDETNKEKNSVSTDETNANVKLNKNNDSSDPEETSDHSEEHKSFWITRKVNNSIDKVSEIFTGGPKHFTSEGSDKSYDSHYVSNYKEASQSNEHYRSHFTLPDEETLVASYYTRLQRTVMIHGKIYLGVEYICYRSMIPKVNIKMIIPYTEIENVCKETGFNFGYSGLVVVAKARQEIYFEFTSQSARDDCEDVLNKQLEIQRKKIKEFENHSKFIAPQKVLDSARFGNYKDLLGLPTDIPIIIDDITSKDFVKVANELKPKYRFTLLTIGSRGDVQPYIALGLKLLKEGHHVKIATHLEFKELIEGYGIEFSKVAGDPAELMQLMIEHGSLSITFLKDAMGKFKKWIDELLQSSWEACQDTDILIESPSAMAGIHIAEKLRIPYFRAFTMPWTRTRAYNHAFIVSENNRGGSYNYLTYVTFETIFWKGINTQVNRWRVNTLGIGRTNLDKMQQNKIPFLYMISAVVFPPAIDFSAWIKVTGYWVLPPDDSYEPPKELLKFIDDAKSTGKKIIYIGFGSIIIQDPIALTKAIIEAVEESGVACVLTKGWSQKAVDKKTSEDNEIDTKGDEMLKGNKNVFLIPSIPHDWLFPRIDAAIHHGGSGTTGSSLRFGLPTVIKPFFADQFFFANRVEKLGAGIFLKKLTQTTLAKAIKQVTQNETMISKAKAIGEEIFKEEGVNEAVLTIYRDLEYARSLTKSRAQKSVLTEKEKREYEEEEEEEADDEDDEGDNVDKKDDNNGDYYI